MSHKTEHVGHWEGLEMWLSVTTNSILPKAAEALQHQTQDQLDDNITSIMRQDPSQNYNHKELAKITSSLSHTLIATLKLSDKHAAQRQQELTSAQRRIEQLERERQEGTDEVEQGADEEEINRLKETLAATSHEMQQLKEDFADRADKLQYAEKLLEKAKTDFRDKNSRIKALEAHLAESRNEISRLTRQLDYVTEESESFQEELKHAYELRQEPSRTGRAPTAPLPSRTKSPVPGLTREHKTDGVVLKQSPAPSEELYITTEPEESAAASRRSSHGLDLKDLDKLARNVGKFSPSVPNSQKVQAYLQDIDFHLEMRPNVTDKDKLDLLRTTSSTEVRSFLDRQPASTKTDYQLLQKALVKEFADPESDQGLVAALETRQGHHEPPQDTITFTKPHEIIAITSILSVSRESVCRSELTDDTHLAVYAVSTQPVTVSPTRMTIRAQSPSNVLTAEEPYAGFNAQIQQILSEADALHSEVDHQGLKEVLQKYKDSFAKDSLDCGLTNIHTVRIPTNPNAPSTFVHQYKIPIASYKPVQEIVDHAWKRGSSGPVTAHTLPRYGQS